MPHTLDYKNISLQFDVMGAGKAVVLLHGFGEDKSIWNEISASLSASHQLIVPDIPGSGNAAMLGGENIGMGDYADSLFAILQKEGVEQCTVIGHSMGGYIALAFAEKYPQMLYGLGLFHSSAYADDDAKKETRKKGIEFIKANGVDAFLKTSTPGLFMDASASKANIDDLLQKSKLFKPGALIQYYEAMIARPDRTHVLKNFKGPVLFMLGAHDKAVPFEQGLEQSNLPGESHIHVLRNSAHMGMLEEREKSLLNITDFLRQIYV